MKTKLRSISKMALSFVLTLCMLFACVNVGTLMANAADPNGWRIWIKNADYSYGDMIATNVHNRTFSIAIDNNKLIGDNLEIYLQDENNNPYGNNVNLTRNESVTVSQNSGDDKYSKSIKLINAKYYSSITLTVGSYNNGNISIGWTGDTPNSHTVTFGVVGGTGGNVSAKKKSDNSNVTSGSSISHNTQVEFTANPTTNYLFIGWFDNSSGSGTAVSTSDTYIKSIDADTSLYAKFMAPPSSLYNKVTYSAAPKAAYGDVTAVVKGTNTEVASGSSVLWSSGVTLTAAPKTGYKFVKWTVDGTDSGTNTTLTLDYVTADTTVKAWFTADTNDGTPIDSGPYFRYGTTDNITSNESLGWANINVKNGRAYGYIDTPGTNNTYYFTVSNGQTDWNAGIWTYDKGACVTDFSGYVDVGTADVKNNGNVYYDNGKTYKLGTAKAKSSRVSKLIIDLGYWNGKSFSLDNDTFRVIPVYDTDATNIDIYAKNGSYRSNSTYDYFWQIGDITAVKTVASDNSEPDVTNFQDHDVMATGTAQRGEKIKVTAKVNDGYKNLFYIRGFSFNGYTPELLKESSDNIYTSTYEIPEDFEDDYLEITPIYYYKASTNTNTVRFYIQNYDKDLQATGWGNTLYVYPYYSYVGGEGAYADGMPVYNKDNAFGGYPGQPVINNGGRYYVDIPTTFTRDGHTRSIKGVTLSNGYWDIVHREYVKAVPDHKQTYDYDDFYKIYKETSEGYEVNGKEGAVDIITFAFKYKTVKNNFNLTGDTAEYNQSDNVNYDQNVHQPYESFTAAEKDSKFEKWEDLLDGNDRQIDLFGKQLTASQKNLDPVLVVSDDYKVTYAGYYATTWTVYARTDTSSETYTKVEEIAPSALIVTSSGRLATTTYPADADKNGLTAAKLADYSDEYEALKDYAGRPVKITYEYTIENNSSYEKYFSKTYTEDGKTKNYSSEVALRSDGRWTYAYYRDDITANIQILYKNNESENWNPDSFRTGTSIGTVTNADAHFTNSDFNGETNVKTKSSVDGKFQFTATEVPGYIFQGWWLEKDNIETLITMDLNGTSDMTSSGTFNAHYVKAPTGSLIINHRVDPASTGSGTTYIKVVAVNTANNTSTTLTNSEGDDFVQASHFEIPNTYVAYGSNYRFDVTLKTVADQFSKFDKFSEDTGNGITMWSKNDPQYTAAGSNGEVTFSVNVNELFTLDTNSFPQQTTDRLDYYSTLTLDDYYYVFTYNYPAFVTAYGNLGYVVRGKFTHGDLDKYMQISNGALAFKPDTQEPKVTPMADFLNLVAPYEDNFMATISWNTDAVTPAYNAAFSDGTTTGKTLTATINGTEPSEKNVKLNFELPYEHATTAEDKFAPKSGENVCTVDEDGNTTYNGQPAEVACVDARVFAVTAGYGQVYSFNTVKNNFDQSGKPELLTAPKVIYKTVEGVNTPFYFRYWSITAKSEKHEDVEYTRSYNYEFDYVLFQDSTVKAIYEPLGTIEDPENAGQTIPEPEPTPRTELDKDKSGVTITFMENSRNQYNENLNGDMEQVDSSFSQARLLQGDRIYTNFLLSYNNVIKDSNGKEIILKDYDNTNNDFKVGLIVERVAELPMVNGEHVVEDESVYKDHYGTTLADIGLETKNNIESVIDGNSVRGFLKSEFNISELNNKNRINYYYNMPNRNHSDMQVSSYRYQLYRAYTYIVDKRDSGNVIRISEVPVYFTIYDMGSIENYSEMTGGNS